MTVNSNTSLATASDAAQIAPPPPRSSRTPLAVRLGLPFLAFVVLIVLWQVLVAALDIKPYILPAPIEVAKRFVDEFPTLWDASLTTGWEVLAGFLVAAVISVPLAYVIASSRWVEITLYPLIVVLQTVPKIAVAPLFIVWFGIGGLPKILLTFLLCFFPILVNSLTGFKPGCAVVPG